MSLAERVLTAFCRGVDDPEYEGGSARATLENALSFLIKTVPDFLSLIKDKDVLDFGCGYGLQAIAMAQAGARTVTGLDLPRPILLEKWAENEKLGRGKIRLVTAPPQEKFDAVISCSSFEHFPDPAAIFEMMKSYARPGGLLIISFAEPWLSPRGAHCDSFTRLPWVNCLFSEKTVMKVRSRYKRDGAIRYEDVEGGLNRMTIQKFERIMLSSGMKIRSLNLFPVKGLPMVSEVPMLREFLTASASCVLEA